MRYFHASLYGSIAGAAALSIVLPATVHAADDASFTVPKISSFDGKSWGDLVLGQTTQDGVKKAFRNDRGDYSASVAVVPSGDLPFKVSALYPNKDKNATLQGIVVRYRSSDDGLPLEKVIEQLGDNGEKFYAKDTRYEDWWLVAYPQRGILLFVVAGKVNMILFGYPERIPQTLNLVAPNVIPIDPLEKRYEGRIPELVYGTTDVSFSLGDNIYLRDKREEERRIVEDMRYRMLEGLRYQSGSTGKFSISVDVSYKKDKGGTGTISGTIMGDGKYGPLQTTVSNTFKIDSGMDQVQLDSTKYFRTLRDTLRAVEEDAAQKARTQGPPPLSSFRIHNWDQLVDAYRFHSDPPPPTKPNNGGGLLGN